MDRPILFSAPMVRALLDGRKTQTRRVAKVKRGVTIADISEWVGEQGHMARRGVFQRHQIADPLYAVGDRLYVREAWRTSGSLDSIPPRHLPVTAPIIYEADALPAPPWRGRLRPGMHMPRWASRLTLAVTEVRVQRLQNISPADARDEGVDRQSRKVRQIDLFGATAEERERIFLWEYEELWDSLNAARGFGWQDNPWVVAVSFKVERRNIDEAS